MVKIFHILVDPQIIPIVLNTDREEWIQLNFITKKGTDFLDKQYFAPKLKFNGQWELRKWFSIQNIYQNNTWLNSMTQSVLLRINQ